MTRKAAEQPCELFNNLVSKKIELAHAFKGAVELHMPVAATQIIGHFAQELKRISYPEHHRDLPNISAPLWALRETIYKRDLELAEILLKTISAKVVNQPWETVRCVNRDGNIHAQDASSPLIQAIDFGQIKMVELLLKYGANPNSPSEQSADWSPHLRDTYTPLAKAMNSGNAAATALLINAGANVRAKCLLTYHSPGPVQKQVTVLSMAKELPFKEVKDLILAAA